MADVQLTLLLRYDAPAAVPVTQLRAELRAWLVRVGEGHDVVVTERGRPVAWLVPVSSNPLLGQQAGIHVAPAAAAT